MKRLLWLGALAAPLLLSTPQQSQAWQTHPNCAHGYPWLQAKCLNKFAWIHMHGPLYNYGPYNCYGAGYTFRPFPEYAFHHGYYPAYPAAVFGYGGYAAQAYGAPPNGAVPPTAATNNGHAPNGTPTVVPAPNGTPVPSYTVPGPAYPSNSYPSQYPSYPQPAWPGVQR
jgi:hypothetical protein